MSPGVLGGLVAAVSRRRTVASAALAPALLALPANIVAGVHWPTDVLGGWLWAAALVLPAAALLRPREKQGTCC
jgi:membrane-associated phospholipid phosphatase